MRAADRIKELEAEVERLRIRLEQVLTLYDQERYVEPPPPPMTPEAIEITRRMRDQDGYSR